MMETKTKFKIEIRDTKIINHLKASVNIMLETLETPELLITDKCFQLKGLSPSHIQYQFIYIDPSECDSYYCEEKFNSLIDLESLNFALSRIKKDDTLYIESYGTEDIILKLENQSMREFTINLIDMEKETPAPPNLTYSVSVELETKVLKDAIEDITKVSKKGEYDKSRVYFKMENEYYLTIGTKNDNQDYRTRYITFDRIPEGESYCTLNTLHNIKNQIKKIKSEVVRLEFSDDHPLNIIIVEGENKHIILTAPRISEDDIGIGFKEPVQAKGEA